MPIIIPYYINKYKMMPLWTPIKRQTNITHRSTIVSPIKPKEQFQILTNIASKRKPIFASSMEKNNSDVKTVFKINGAHQENRPNFHKQKQISYPQRHSRSPIFNSKITKTYNTQQCSKMTTELGYSSEVPRRLCSPQHPFVIGDNGPLYDEDINRKTKGPLIHSQIILEMQKIIKGLQHKFQAMESIQLQNMNLKQQNQRLVKEKLQLNSRLAGNQQRFNFHETQNINTSSDKKKQFINASLILKELKKFNSNYSDQIENVIQLLQNHF